MAQFDVHANMGPNREAIPFVVVIQSALYDDYRRRVVVPLVRKSAVEPPGRARFNPGFRIKGLTVVLHPLEIASVPRDRLGEPVASLASDGQRIVDALDELLTRSWG